jgi:hypothetical protein
VCKERGEITGARSWEERDGKEAKQAAAHNGAKCEQSGCKDYGPRLQAKQMSSLRSQNEEKDRSRSVGGFEKPQYIGNDGSTCKYFTVILHARSTY